MRTIKSSAEITRLFEKGRRINTPELSVIVLSTEEQHDQYGRVAFIAGKKQGNAVWRNKSKRRMREACREIGGPFAGYDMAFVARKSLLTSDYSEMINHLRKSLKKAAII